MKNSHLRCARFVGALLAILLSLGASPPAGADGEDARQLDRLFPRSTLQIATPGARVHTFRIWVADDDARRARGLMFVRELAEQEGMLFVYPREQRVAMWMKNTLIALDMLFVDAAGVVVHVVENTEPHSLETIPSRRPVLAVVELKAGAAERLKIRPGARVLHPAFRQ
jgi:uncharacterized protein